MYNMITKMIQADNYDYEAILHKIEAFENNKRLTKEEAEQLRGLLDLKHYQPVVLPELDEEAEV